MKRLRAVFCALFGHARVYEVCIGYVHCGRCGAQLGDTIAGIFVDEGSVSCPCSDCEARWPRLSWRERFLCEQPKWSGKTHAQLREDARREMADSIDAIRKEHEFTLKLEHHND